MAKKKKAVESTVESFTNRVGDKMVTVTIEREPAVIDFATLVAAGEIEQDDDMRAPWEECDGWEHTATESHKLEDRGHFDEVACQAPLGKPCVNCPHHVWVPHYNPKDVVYCDRTRYLIEVERERVVQWQGEWNKYRNETRQVYEERLARCRRDAIEQLKKWYKDGWCYFWGQVRYGDYDASIGGIMAADDDPDDPHIQECIEDMAYEVACHMEKDGYTITNKPTGKKTKEDKLQALRWKIAHNLNFEKPEHYRAWVESRSN